VVPTGFSDPEYEEVALGKGYVPPRLRREMAELLLQRIEADQERTDLIARRTAAAHRDGRVCLLLARHLPHCRALLAAVRELNVEVEMLQGGAEHRRAFRAGVDALRSGHLRCAVGSPATFTGLNVPQLDWGGIAVPQAGNMRLFDQMTGRLRRKFPGKESAELVYFWDERVHPGHANAISKFYRRFKGLVTIEGKDGA